MLLTTVSKYLPSESYFVLQNTWTAQSKLVLAQAGLLTLCLSNIRFGNAAVLPGCKGNLFPRVGLQQWVCSDFAEMARVCPQMESWIWQNFWSSPTSIPPPFLPTVLPSAHQPQHSLLLMLSLQSWDVTGRPSHIHAPVTSCGIGMICDTPWLAKGTCEI